MENEEPGQCLRCGFHSPAQCSLRSTVRHENYIFGFEQRVWGFPRQDLSQVNRRLLPLTTLLIGADDSRPGLRGGTSEALAQGQRLQNGNLFIRFQSESARPSNLANHVNNPSASDRSEEHTSELQSLAYLVC